MFFRLDLMKRFLVALSHFRLDLETVSPFKTTSKSYRREYVFKDSKFAIVILGFS